MTTRRKFLPLMGLPAMMAALAVMLGGCGEKNYFIFRYRLTFSVMVDGLEESASSIIETHYIQGTMPDGGGASGHSSYRGVAPVIDLGSRGWLVAAMDFDSVYSINRKKRMGLMCRYPSGAAELPKAFGLHARDLEKLPDGTRSELADDNYPGFVWFATNARLEEGVQICPGEFTSVIGGAASLRSISIEAAPDAPLVHKLDGQMLWLEEIRKDFSEHIGKYEFPRFVQDKTVYEW